MPVYRLEVSLTPEGGEQPPGGEEEGKTFFQRVGDILGVSEQTAMWIVAGGAGLLLILLLRR